MALVGSKPNVLNIVLTQADTEYSQVIPTGTKKLTLQNRDDEDIKFSFAEGTSGSVFQTLPAGGSLSESDINTHPGVTIYAQTPVAGGTMEIIVWV